jgi:hypothetical protein
MTGCADDLASGIDDGALRHDQSHSVIEPRSGKVMREARHPQLKPTAAQVHALGGSRDKGSRK